MPFASVKISSSALRELIEDSDKSIAMIARELDVSTGAIFNWLKQPMPGVDPEVFHRLLAFFNVKAAELKVIEDDDVKGKTLARMASMAWTAQLSTDEVIAHFKRIKAGEIKGVNYGMIGRTAASMSPPAQRKSDAKDDRKGKGK